MARRKQAKAVGSVVANANGDASSSRKRKITTATKPVVEESKLPRTGLRRGRAEKTEVNNIDAAIDVSSPKKLRGGSKNKTAEPKPTIETKSGKSNKVTKTTKTEETMNNNANEKTPKQTVEKKTRATKTVGAMTKMAGTKEQPAAKSKAKESAKKSKNNATAIDNSAGGDATQEINAIAASKKRTRKVMEKENAMPAARTASAVVKVPKKRKNTEEKALTAAEDMEIIEEEEVPVTVPNKKPRGKPKKAEEAQAANEPETKPRGRSKKNTVKAETTKSSLKETKEQDVQDIVEQKDTAKTESTKSTKKRNAKKAAPRGKRNATALSSISEVTGVAQAENAITEIDIQENEKIENAQVKQQKKRNTGKANAATKEKTETKGRQKKVQATSATTIVDVKELTKDTSTEDDAVEKVNTRPEVQNENDMIEIAQNNNAPNKKEAKDEAEKADLPESVESMQPIKIEILESNVNISTDKDEN